MKKLFKLFSDMSCINPTFSFSNMTTMSTDEEEVQILFVI